jgi:hypothetical protein
VAPCRTQDVTISSPGAPELQFLANRWLATDEADGQTYCTLYPSTSPSSAPQLHKYRVTVITSDVRGAGTDARVFITLFGSAAAAAAAGVTSCRTGHGPRLRCPSSGACSARLEP